MESVHERVAKPPDLSNGVACEIHDRESREQAAESVRLLPAAEALPKVARTGLYQS